MKKQFHILKERPKISLRITRDSVCAGDDIDAPHELVVETHSFLDPMALASHIATGYLPSISGIGYSWDCLLNDKLFATISAGGIEPKVTEVSYAGINHIHLRYRSAMY